MKNFARLLESVAWRLLPHARLEMELPSGLRLAVRDRGEWACLGEVFVGQVYDGFLRRPPPPRGWVDLGCNVGFFSLAVEHDRRLRGATSPSRALLVDAHPGCVHLTAGTLRRNGLSDWTVRQALIGPAGQEVPFHQFKHSVHSGIFSPQRGERVIRLAATPLAHLLAGADVPRDLIKVDIEGAERCLFDQEPELVSTFRAGLCEWHTPQMPGRELAGRIAGAGGEIIFLKSQPVDWPPARGDSLESPVGVLGWLNPRAAGG